MVSAQHEFYLERAAEARAAAGTATLGNVRDRWLRSEASWAEMALRSERGDKMRAKLIAEKAMERAALKTGKQAGRTQPWSSAVGHGRGKTGE